ncbi:hypothetical protein BLNAU_7347 [Blattamonas nauphoetae]|uniref:C3H1-type domain-containing protein n=1 Tax=Blattamonas nauphoetae TaxID=2049346 RepID=A0ABQ9Y1T2_9EUKA|nr:hypothetical protein BLNAU_7347 [Blattamonas nauphoetae]
MVCPTILQIQPAIGSHSNPTSATTPKGSETTSKPFISHKLPPLSSDPLLPSVLTPCGCSQCQKRQEQTPPSLPTVSATASVLSEFGKLAASMRMKWLQSAHSQNRRFLHFPDCSVDDEWIDDAFEVPFIITTHKPTPPYEMVDHSEPSSSTSASIPQLPFHSPSPSHRTHESRGEQTVNFVVFDNPLIPLSVSVASKLYRAMKRSLHSTLFSETSPLPKSATQQPPVYPTRRTTSLRTSFTSFSDSSLRQKEFPPKPKSFNFLPTLPTLGIEPQKRLSDLPLPEDFHKAIKTPHDSDLEEGEVESEEILHSPVKSPPLSTLAVNGIVSRTKFDLDFTPSRQIGANSDTLFSDAYFDQHNVRFCSLFSLHHHILTRSRIHCVMETEPQASTHKRPQTRIQPVNIYPFVTFRRLHGNTPKPEQTGTNGDVGHLWKQHVTTAQQQEELLPPPFVAKLWMHSLVNGHFAAVPPRPIPGNGVVGDGEIGVAHIEPHSSVIESFSTSPPKNLLSSSAFNEDEASLFIDGLLNALTHLDAGEYLLTRRKGESRLFVLKAQPKQRASSPTHDPRVPPPTTVGCEWVYGIDPDSFCVTPLESFPPWMIYDLHRSSMQRGSIDLHRKHLVHPKWNPPPTAPANQIPYTLPVQHSFGIDDCIGRFSFCYQFAKFGGCERGSSCHFPHLSNEEVIRLATSGKVPPKTTSQPNSEQRKAHKTRNIRHPR